MVLLMPKIYIEYEKRAAIASEDGSILRLTSSEWVVQHSYVKLYERLHPFHGGNDIGETYAKFLIDDHNFASCNKFFIY